MPLRLLIRQARHLAKESFMHSALPFPVPSNVLMMSWAVLGKRGLLCCSAVVLLFCYTAVLLYCYTAARRGKDMR